MSFEKTIRSADEEEYVASDHVFKSTYEYFSRELRQKILALCLNDTWMARFGDAIIRPEYFERDDEEAFAKAVLQYRETYSRSPRDPHDVIHLCNGKFATFILDIYEVMESEDLSLAGDVAVQFAKEQAAKIAIIESVDDIKTGNISKAIERMKEALKVGEDLLSPGIDPIRDIDKWLYEYWSNKVRTGWTQVDKILEGGLGIGEEGIIIGPPNRGKSMALINLGYGAATLGSGKSVVHVTHEMRVEQVAKRYAARMVFRFPKPNDNLEDYAEDVITTARKLLKGKIRIIYGLQTPEVFEAKMQQLINEEFELGLIIDDYLDKMSPPRHYTERRFELSATYDWFREMLIMLGIPGWSATQAGRASLSKEIITMADVAEDIGKANIADVMIAVCQTYDEQQLEQCRLFMAKVRDSPSRAMIQAKYYSKSQAIVTTGFVHKKEDKDV